MPSTVTRPVVPEPAPEERDRSRGFRGASVGRQLVVIGALTALGWFVVRLVVGWADVRVGSPGSHGTMLALVSVVAATVTGLLVRLGTLGRPYAAPALVAATSVGLSGMATAALHGTRWSFNGLYSDAGFRTQAVTRFADSPALSDYGYRGLPSYYPPALPWVEGRLADLVGAPGWAVMKPVTLVLAVLVPVAAYLMWRRVVPDLLAALVVGATSLAAADLDKPDEWLVLAVVVPWWLDAVRDVRTPGRGRLPWWVHGLLLGGLLLFHTFYFAPLALATLAAALVDAFRRRPMPLRPGRAIAIAALGLLCAAPYWVPVAWERVSGAESDALQLRWSPPGFTWPPWPVPPGAVGCLGLVGVLWLLLGARRKPLALSLGVALVSSYAFMIGGQVLQVWGVTLLPEKAEDLVLTLLVVTGVLGIHDLGQALAGRAHEAAGRAVKVAAACLLAASLVLDHAQHWLVGQPAQAAQHMRYPDGSFPAGGPFAQATHRHPWSVSPQPTGPSVDEVRDRWRRLTGGDLDDATVLVTSRADVLATTPVHPFIAWKSIYSHPNGRFQDRLALLRRVSSCGTPRCASALLRTNPFDQVDGLVLAVTASGLGLTVTTDEFPDGWRMSPVTFPPGLFEAPYFGRADVDGVAVVAVRPGPG